jgi:uncharacterized cupin superfamily protein
MQKAADQEEVEIREGDVVLVRTGWINIGGIAKVSFP